MYTLLFFSSIARYLSSQCAKKSTGSSGCAAATEASPAESAGPTFFWCMREEQSRQCRSQSSTIQKKHFENTAKWQLQVICVMHSHAQPGSPQISESSPYGSTIFQPIVSIVLLHDPAISIHRNSPFLYPQLDIEASYLQVGGVRHLFFVSACESGSRWTDPYHGSVPKLSCMIRIY